MAQNAATLDLEFSFKKVSQLVTMLPTLDVKWTPICQVQYIISSWDFPSVGNLCQTFERRVKHPRVGGLDLPAKRLCSLSFSQHLDRHEVLKELMLTYSS